MTFDEDIRRLSRGARVGLAGQILARGAQLGSQVLLARVLGPTPFGLYSIGVTVLRSLLVVGPLGLDQAVIRFGARMPAGAREERRGIVTTTLVGTALAGLLLGGGLALSAPLVAHRIFGKPGLEPILRLIAIAVPAATVLSVAASATRLSGRLEFMIASQELGQPLINLLLLAAILPLGLGTFGATSAFTVSYLAAAFLALALLRRILGPSTGVSTSPTVPFGGLVRFALPTWLLLTAASYLQFTDRLVLGALRSADEAGVYQAVSQAALVFTVLAAGINSIFSTMVPGLEDAGHGERLARIFRVATRWGIHLGVPVLVVAILRATEIVSVLFGPAYVAGIPVLGVLCTAQFIAITAGPIATYFVMTGRQNAWLAVLTAALGIVVVLGFLLIPSRGMMGAALAASAAMATLPIAGAYLLRKVAGFLPWDRSLWKDAVAGLASAGAVFALGRVIPLPPIWSLALASAASAGVFGGTLLLLGLEPEDLQLLPEFFSRGEGGAPRA